MKEKDKDDEKTQEISAPYKLVDCVYSTGLGRLSGRK